MAVAHSASSESHTGSTGSANQTSFSWTHTQTGTPRGVLVFVHVTNSSTDTVTGVTYGTVALTRIPGGAAIDAAGEPIRADLFFAGKGLPAGNQTVTVSRNNNGNIMYATVATVTAATDTNVTGIVLLQGDGTLTQQNVDDGSPGANSVRYAGATSGLNAPPTAGANSTLLQSIDVGNQSCALVRETTAGQGSRPVGFSTASDDRAAIHVAVRELFNRTFSQTVASFTLTGKSADLKQGYKLSSDRGSFSLVGKNADLRHNLKVSADRGTFTLTGNTVTLTVTSQAVLDAEVGNFTLTGKDAGIRHNAALLGERGSFTVDGKSVDLDHDVVLDVDTGVFSLTGTAVEFTRGLRLSADVGLFNLVGNSVSLVDKDTLPAVRGDFSLTGGAVQLLKAYVLSPDTAEFTLSGSSVFVLYSHVLPADLGSFSLVGRAATLSSSRKIFVETGAFSLTGNPTSDLEDFTLAVNAGEFSVTGPAVGLDYEQRRRVVFVF